MKVNGQLERAQLEQLTSDPTPGTRGRVFVNIATPANPIPKMDTGTAIMPFKLGQSDGVFTQNAGTATTTVDWSTGLQQRVLLFTNTTINFSNPRDGEKHYLFVVQATSFMYSYNFDMVDQESAEFNYQPTGMLPEGQVQSYCWFYKTAIRAANTTIPTNSFLPITAPATATTGLDISSNSKFSSVGLTSSPFSSGYNVKKTAPIRDTPLYNVLTASTAAAGAVIGVKYSPDASVIFLVGATSPFIQASPALNGYFGTAFANPATLPTGAARYLDVHPTGLFVAVAHGTTPFMSVYNFTGRGFGAKLANPATLPAAIVNGIAFSPLGDYLATACQTSPFIRVYAFNTQSASIGAAAANPGTLPAGGPAYSGISWRPQGDYIAMTMSAAPYIYVVPFDRTTGTFGTPLTISNAPSAQCYECNWSRCGNYLMVCSTASPWAIVYDFSAKAMNNVVAYSGSNPGGATSNIVSDPKNNYFLTTLAAGTFLMGYTLPNVQKNYLRLS